MLYLKAYTKDDTLVSKSDEVINNIGQVTIKNLQPGTFYAEGDFYVRWVGDKFSSGKIPLPPFTTLQGSKKDFIFYWDDALIVETKTAYDIAVENGFRGTESEWVESIKGDPGKDGSDGKDGANSYELALQNGFKGTQEEWLESLKGEPGKDFKYSDFTKEQLENLKGEPGKDFKYSDFTEEQLEKLKGEKGKPGENAYEIAVKNGFEGSLGEWLKSLEGEKGKPGEDAYEIAVKNGYNGTLNEWLKSLKGEPGEQGETPTLPDFSNWQKYKLVDDNGTVKSLEKGMDLEDKDFLNSLSAGFYYVPSPINAPVGYSGFLAVFETKWVKVIYFQPYSQDRLAVNRYYKEWYGWKELTDSYSDTGWLSLPLINGATKAGSANLPEYRFVTINDTNLLFIRGAVQNITSRTMTFAKLPTNISQKISSYAEYSKVKINPYTNKSAIYNITMTNSGELKITFEPNSTADVSTPYYIEGTISL